MAGGALVVHGLPGPFHAVVDEAGDLLDACDFRACAARCEAALPWVEALGDRSTAGYLRYVGALALVELVELDRAGELLEELLDAPAGQDPLWRAKALALAAEIAFTRGRPARGVEHLAEALGLLESTGSRHVNRLSAAMASGLALQAAGVHPEAEVLLRRVLADVPGTPGVSELNVLPELVLLVAERAAGAQLRGEPAEADHQWGRVLELSLRWRRRGVLEGEASQVLRSSAAEALAWQRLGDHAAASAAGAAVGSGLLGAARSGALLGRVEGVMARLHLAGEAHHRGDAAAARTHLDEALAETRRTEPGVWAYTVLAALAELDAEERRSLHGEDARPDRWKELAQALLVRTAASSRAIASELEARRRAARAADAHDAAALAVLTDPLTGVTNRRGLDEALRAAARDGTEVAACFVDVDRFKAVNDGFSHEVGDEVLRRVAALLVDVTRGHDLVARYGGDEFVVLSGHPRDLAALGQRVVDEVAALPWAQVAPGLRVSVSVGVTGPLAAHAVLASADAAMLDAKRRGRARAVVRRAS